MSDAKPPEERDLEGIAPVTSHTSHIGQVDDGKEHHDAVFGDMGEDGPNYRSVRTTVTCEHGYWLIPFR